MLKIFFGMFLGVIILIIIGSLGGDVKDINSPSLGVNNNNYDGSYNISPSSSTGNCGGLSYQFKVRHAKAGRGSMSKMFRGNCRQNSDGSVEGYIYPKARPNIRIFWINKAGVLDYKD